jgi:type II secretion system protein J
MNVEIRNAKPAATPRSNSRGAEALRQSIQRRHARSAFTLLEVLIALLILAMVMGVIHSIFYGALQLRNKTDQSFEDAIPLQHALAMIKRDMANLTVPGGTLTGTFQTSATTGSTTSSTHYGQQVGPTFYTASGVVSDLSAWSEIQKVSYYLAPATNGGAGLDLIRAVTRNLLPVMQDEYADQRLLGGVENLTFQYYNGSSWVDTWDSTTTSLSSSTTNLLPQGIRVQLTLAAEAVGKLTPPAIEMVIPIAAQTSTNSATSSTGGGG